MGVKDQNVIACKDGLGLHAARGKQRVAQLEHQANCLRERLAYLETVLPFESETAKAEDSRKSDTCGPHSTDSSKCLLQTLAAKEKTLRKVIYDMKCVEENYVKTLAEKFNDPPANPEEGSDPTKAEELDQEKAAKSSNDVRTRILRLEAYGKKLCTNLRNLQKNRFDLTQEAEDLSKELDMTREGFGCRKKRSKKRCPNLVLLECKTEDADKKEKETVECFPTQTWAKREAELKKRSGCPCGGPTKCESCTICTCAEWEKDLDPDAVEKEEEMEVPKECQESPSDRGVKCKSACRRCNKPKRPRCPDTECGCAVTATSENDCDCGCFTEYDYDSSTTSFDESFNPDCTTLTEDACLECQSSCSVCRLCLESSKFANSCGLYRPSERCRGGVDHLQIDNEPSCTSDWSCTCGKCVKTEKGCYDARKSPKYKDNGGSMSEKASSDITCICNLCNRTALLKQISDSNKKDRLAKGISDPSSLKRYSMYSTEEKEKVRKAERCRGGVDTDPSVSKCTCSCTLCVLRNTEGDPPPCCSDAKRTPRPQLACGCDVGDPPVPNPPGLSPEITKLCHVTQLRESLEKLKNRNYALRKLLKDCGCQASNDITAFSKETGASNEPPTDSFGDHPRPKSSATSTNNLIITLKTLQSKCRIKDGMIVALADELRRNGTPEQTTRILRCLADPNLSKQTNDFDRTTLWTYLTQTAESSSSGQCVSGDLETTKDLVFGSIVLLLVLVSTFFRSSRLFAISRLARETLRNARDLVTNTLGRGQDVLSETSAKLSATVEERVSLLVKTLSGGKRHLDQIPPVDKKIDSSNWIGELSWVGCWTDSFNGLVGLYRKLFLGNVASDIKMKGDSAEYDCSWLTSYVVMFFVAVACYLYCLRLLKWTKGVVVDCQIQKPTFVYALCVVLGYSTNKLLSDANFQS